MIVFVVPARGAFSVDNYLSLDPPELTRRFRVIHYEELPGLTECPRGTWVLAGLDQLTPGQLRLVTELHQQLSGEEGVGFLNHPARTLRRFDLLRELHRLGRNDFRAVRAGDDLAGLRYPVFVRRETMHTGPLSPLLNTPAEVEKAVGRALVQGHPLADLLVVEFSSTLCPDGIYRKYSAFIVGNRIMGRSVDHGTRWGLKFGGVDHLTRPLILEEQAYVMENPHQAVLAEIFAIAGVEYGRIDYSLKDGRVQTWEINLNATMGRGTGPSGGIGPKEHWPIRNATREYFFDRFREAWAEVDRIDGPPSSVAFRVDAEIRSGAVPAPPPMQRPFERVQALLRPLKGWLEPVSGPFFRMMGAAGRRVWPRRR